MGRRTVCGCLFGNVFVHDFPLLVLLPLEENVWKVQKAEGAPCSTEGVDLPGAERGLEQSPFPTATPSWGQEGTKVSTEPSQHLMCPQNLMRGITARLPSRMSRSHLARGRLLVGYNSSQLSAIKPHGVFLEKLTSFFLSLALNNPRAWLPCTVGLAQNNAQWAGNAATCF